MSTTTVQGSGSTVNNGGTMLGAGNVVAGSPITKVIDVNDINGSKSYYGTKVVVDTNGGASNADPHGVTKAVSAGTFAYTPPKGEEFLIRAGGSNASKINGTSSSILTIPGGVSNKSINKLTSTRRLGAYADAEFNVLARPNGDVVPGRTKGTGAGSASNYVQADDGTTTTGVDEAASPTRSVPGELTYMFGSKSPKLDNYKARDSYES